jgi:hypothetical protein
MKKAILLSNAMEQLVFLSGGVKPVSKSHFNAVWRKK